MAQSAGPGKFTRAEQAEDDRRRVNEDDPIYPGDTLIVEQSFF